MDLEKALAQISTVMRTAGIPYMVIGGAAVILRGGTRTTQDIDVTVWVSETMMPDAIAKITAVLKPRVPDPAGFAGRTRVLPVMTGYGLPADIIFGMLPFEEEAVRTAETMDVAGEPVRVCGVAELIVHKVISERPQDTEDMRFLVTRHAKSINRESLDRQIAALAADTAKPEIFQRYLDCWK